MLQYSQSPPAGTAFGVKKLLYVIDAFDEDDETTTMTRPVEEEDAQYLREKVLPLLQPLSAEEYSYGPAAILGTGAHYSYVLDGAVVYWCVEWDPGLLVLRFTPDGEMAWAALKSPVPGFGGREATEAEWDAYDEDARNPQYRLVFDAWDDIFDRDREGWEPISASDREAYTAALAPVNALSDALKQQWESRSEEYLERCKTSPIWRGEVVMAEGPE
jgi:hypothetical protein